MTDDNRSPVTPDEGTPKFGTDKGTTEGTPSFGKDDIEKVLSQSRHAQDHIKTLETETATLRTELRVLQEEVAKSRSIDDLIAAMQQDQGTNSTGPKAPQLDQQELLTKLKQEVFRDLSTSQQQALEQKNWQQSISVLKERFGDKFGHQVDKRAEELGMPIEQMEIMAKTSPAAFIELVAGVKTTRTPAPTMGSQSAPYNSEADIEVMYARVIRLKTSNSPEGKEARKTWGDPEFQKQYRAHILSKAKKAGSSYGNMI